MCGIAGYLGRGDHQQLAAMAARIAHRGPDGEGFWLDAEAGVGLAHRRLAIIDLTNSAAQPMASCNGRYHVVFNGEIYNFRELGAELKGQGYVFNPNSDTAVLGPLYDRHGPDFLPKLNGIFAFALWDSLKRELFVARDAFGVKPLYYTQSAGTFAFASELKALIAVEGWDRTLDEEALLNYLVHLWSPGERTPFVNVSKLLPGHALIVGGGRAKIVEWYRPPVQTRAALTDSGQAVTQIRETFDRAVSDQCLSDVPVGAFLSGGVDSSAIVASMMAGGHAPARTYCVGFNGPSMQAEGFGDDLGHAINMANRLGVSLQPIMVSEPDPAALEELPYVLDEPQADPAALYVGQIAAAAQSDGIKVLLGGTGGDDIYSGYRRHQAAALRARLGPLARAIPTNWSRCAFISPAYRRRIERLGYLFQGTDEEFLARAFEFNRRDDVLACIAPEMAQRLSVRESGRLALAVQRSRGAPLLQRMLHAEMHGFLPDHNLNYTDKAAMRHGVEVRVPFLDKRLVEHASGLPWQLKLRGLKEKWIFKQAMIGRLPESVLWRAKTGFGAPVRHWFSHGRLREMARDVFASRSFRQRGIFNTSAIDNLLANTVSNRSDSAYLMFAIIMIEFWLRRFYDRGAIATKAKFS